MAIESGLNEQLTLLVQAIDQLGIGFTVFDRDLVLIAANKRFQLLLNFPDTLCARGATMEDALRHNANAGEYGRGDVEEQVRQRLSLSRQFLPHQFERVRPDGSIIEVCGNPLPGGGMVTTYTDVTIPRQREQALRELSAELEKRVEERTAELRRREQELAHKAALLESVISNVNQGISFINADLEIEICNQKFGELLQLPPELCKKGVSFEKLARFNAERGEYGGGDIETIVQTRVEVAKKFIPHRFERVRPNDGRTLEIMGIPTASGGMVSTYLDITERKNAETKILRLNETLEERVAERTAQLSAAMQTLHRSQEALARSAAQATLSTLVASVTHELNTPLGNSLMTAGTCSDLTRRFQVLIEAGQIKRSDLAAFLREIGEGSALMERNLHRAVDLVNSFKQVAADQASEQRRSFDVAVVIKEVLETLSPSLKRHSHQVILQVPDDIVVDGFPGAMGQVLINLINNAYLHAFDGRTGGNVRLHAEERDGWVHLNISDDGIGMSKELISQLFQPFFSTKIGSGGTGLGMTIVENLVKKTLGGSISVESTVGVGTTFYVHLPKVAPINPDVVITSQPVF